VEQIPVTRSSDPRRIDMPGPILVAHQPEFLPYLGNISKAAMGDVYLILDTVQFVKQHWQSRNRIRVSHDHGDFQWLTIPLKGVHKHMMLTCDVEPDGDEWKTRHVKTIQLSYAKAPYFKEIFPEIAGVYARTHTKLIDFLMDLIRYAFQKFDIRVPVYQTSELIRSGYPIGGKKCDLIITMCEVVGARTFVFGRDGRTYIEKEPFEKAGIHYVFQEFTHPVYSQFHGGEFLPDMSFIDLLFNYGPAAKDVLGSSGYQDE
jgi:hypothetical protein